MRIIIWLTLLLPLSLQGQELADAYTAFQINYGFNQISGTEGSYDITFQEVSDMNRSFDLTKTIENSINFNSVALQLNFGRYKGLAHSLYLNFPAASTGASKFGYTIGYSYPVEVGSSDLIIKPKLGFGISTVTFHLGNVELYNDSIQINDQVYVNNLLQVAMNNQAWVATGGLDLTYLIKQKIGITLSAGYDLSFREGRYEVSFTPKPDNEAMETSYRFDHENLSISKDEVIFDDRPFRSTGAWFSIGLGFYLNRELY